PRKCWPASTSSRPTATTRRCASPTSFRGSASVASRCARCATSVRCGAGWGRDAVSETAPDDQPPSGNDPSEDADVRPFAVPCRDVAPSRIAVWLQRGWNDCRAAPALSLLFGIVIAVISIGISLFAYSLGRFALLATLLSGFVFV